MKKTERTALTAAIFAAAIGTSAVTGGQAVAIDLAEEPVTAESDLESYATVYGPAPDFEYREPETEAISEEPTENMTMPEFQDVYGPPPTTEPETVESMTQALYGPIWDGGDANLDGKADVFDMPLIRKYVVSDNKFYSDPSVFNSDVNIDGKVNVADLVAFSQFLLGQRDYIGNGETKVKENKIEEEIKTIKAACGDKILKVIIETCYLTDEEKIKLCGCVTRAKAEYIKTSTGFGTGGATFDDVKLFKEHVGPDVKIKAAGGIRTKEDMEHS